MRPTRPSLPRERIILALDTGDARQASDWAAQTAPHVGLVKLGLEGFTRHGPDLLRSVQAASGRPVFLDLKLHDIPNTVAGATASARELGAAMLTLHASGGPAMIAAARAAAGPDGPLLLAVTVLTSTDEPTLAATGVAGGTTAHVLRLARLALEAGADGLVCAASELAALRHAFGPGPALVVPGIRPDAAPADDQARTATPAEAIAAGADWIVIGRPITRAADPGLAAAAIARSLVHGAVAVST